METDFDKMIREEEALEMMRERQEGEYSEWKNENIKELINDFIEDNRKEFDEFLSQEIIDEERDIDYWKEIFCKEEMEDDFYYNCKEIWRMTNEKYR